jgi:hypothetical protein
MIPSGQENQCMVADHINKNNGGTEMNIKYLQALIFEPAIVERNDLSRAFGES